MRHSTTTKSRSSSCAWQLCGGNFVALFVSTDHMDQKAICVVSYPVYFFHSYPASCSHLESVVLASFPAVRVRRRVLFFVVFVLVTFKFVPFLVCLGIANVCLAYSLYNLSVGGMKTPDAATKHSQFYSTNLPFE